MTHLLEHAKWCHRYIGTLRRRPHVHEEDEQIVVPFQLLICSFAQLVFSTMPSLPPLLLSIISAGLRQVGRKDHSNVGPKL